MLSCTPKSSFFIWFLQAQKSDKNMLGCLLHFLMRLTQKLNYAWGRFYFYMSLKQRIKLQSG
jgi:hypothetical protein